MSKPKYLQDFETLRPTLENYLDFSIDVSDATKYRQQVPWKLVRAHQLYNRLTVTTLSFINLLPGNRYFKPAIEHWDFFSIASIARNIIENYHLLYYIGVDPVSQAETDLRLEIFQYHLNSEKYKLYQEMGEAPETLKDFETNLPTDREKIKNNPLFQQVEKGRAGMILKGNEFMCISKKELLDRIPFNTQEIIPMYRFLSNQTHSTPLSFFTQSNERGRGLQNEIEVVYTILCMNLVMKHLVAAIVDVVRLFPDCESKLHSGKLSEIRKLYATY